MQSSSNPTIPVVDFGRWLHGTSENREQIADFLTDACRRVGFVYVMNHGVDQELVTKAFRWSECFFGLSNEQKMLAPHPPGLEKVSDEPAPSSSSEARKVADVKESFEVGSDAFAAQPNVWLPEKVLPGFRDFMTDFYWSCAAVAAELLSALALGLGLDPVDEAPRFLGSHTALNYQLRLLHYPPVERARLARGEVARMPAHTDWGSVTMLFQDGLGGLQVEDPANPGVFVDALPVEGALVLNVGDSLMRWSNDYLKSTRHRVTLPPFQLSSARDNSQRSTNEDTITTTTTTASALPAGEVATSIIPSRFSIPFFVSPDPDAVVECFSSYTSPQRPARYPPMVYEDYRRMRARTNYAD